MHRKPRSAVHGAKRCSGSLLALESGKFKISLSHRKIVFCTFHVRTVDFYRIKPCGQFGKTVGSFALDSAKLSLEQH